MVVTNSNSDITQKNYKKLSIQVSLSGLSFCVLDLLSQHILSLHSVLFKPNEAIEEQLWKVCSDYSILSESYDEIVILHQNSLNTLVPQSLFDENALGSYLQYNVKVFETDLFAFDVLKNAEINNVYVPYVNINNFWIDQYQKFNYLHCNSILIDNLIRQSNMNFEKQVWVHVQPNQFEIIIIQNKKLLFFNSFEPTTPEDFIYYLLFTLEQSQLNPDNCKIQLLGAITEEDAYYKITYQYIRNVVFLDCKTIAKKASITEEKARQYFILLHT